MNVGDKVCFIGGNPNVVHVIVDIFSNENALLSSGIIWNISGLELAQWRYVRL